MSVSEVPTVAHTEEHVGCGNFFHVDARTWAALYDLGNIAAASSYLVIAQGVLGTSSISKWSAKAIEKYTGLHSLRATAAIKVLLERGFLQFHKKTTKRNPLYRVVPFHEFEEVDRVRRVELLTGDAKKLFEKMSQEGSTQRGYDRRLYLELVSAKVAVEHSRKFSLMPPPDKAEQFIWLPDALVCSAAKEPSPLRLLRSRNDLVALRLMVDLYQAQNLSADGGVSRRVVYQQVKRREVTRRGRFIIWGFDPEKSFHHWVPGITAHFEGLPKRKDANGDFVSNSVVWDALSTLQELGLLYPVLHLVENSSVDAEIIHPFGDTKDAEPMEVLLADAAKEAGEYLMGEKVTSWKGANHGYCVPVYDQFANVQMVGIYRLRYRPATQLTADWYRRLKEACEVWLHSYRKMCGDDLATVQAKVS